MLFDLSREARMGLGAEYLPIRDLSHWLEVRVFGISAPAMRLVQLGLYIGAMLAFRAALLRALSNRWLVEISVGLFALHPVHVESVAWLAGRKDVLALLFVGLALWVHTGTSRHRAALVPALFALACLSKSMAVGALGLFVALDLLRRKKPELTLYLGLALATVLVLFVHVYVGRVVGMTTDPAGGTRFTAGLTLGGIWLDYLKLCFWPPALSISHDVVVRSSVDAVAVAGWLLMAMWGALGVWGWRRNDPFPLALWLVFVVPLVPVSQVFFPLENLIADRYLFLSVLAPCLALGLASARIGHPLALPAAALVALALCVFTALRAATFADAVTLFAEATEKTRKNAIAPYQLGQALEAAGNERAALDAYRMALEREPGASDATRRATNNAAKLLARQNRLEEAEGLLVRGRELWPSDPKILANLARVTARQGRLTQACGLASELARRFPRYDLEEPWVGQCSGQ
jgi:tetratricopeptide (TPR) repeat protein